MVKFSAAQEIGRKRETRLGSATTDILRMLRSEGRAQKRGSVQCRAQKVATASLSIQEVSDHE